jgi:hypothetical protein
MEFASYNNIAIFTLILNGFFDRLSLANSMIFEKQLYYLANLLSSNLSLN